METGPELTEQAIREEPLDFATVIWPPLISKCGPPVTLTDPYRFPRDRGGLVGPESQSGIIRRDSAGVSEWGRDH
jgi:hypothetical protein